MLRIKDIQEALLPLVGWEQDYDPERQIDKALCVSESGLTFQGAHPLCTLANIRSIMPEDFIFSYPQYNSLMQYRRGAKVRHNGRVWIANRDNVGVEPLASDFNQDFNNDYGGESGETWIVYNMVSDYVRRLTETGIATAVQTFLQGKQLQGETRTLVERRTLFDGAARLAATITPHGRIVGMEIVPVRSMGVTTRIERIGLQMVGDTPGPVRMYLFHSSRIDPVRVIDIEVSSPRGGFMWYTPTEPIYLPYMGTDTDSGGAWYLCYNQGDLPSGMEALNVSKDWSVEPCQTCLGGSIESWRQITKYLQISPFAVQSPETFEKYPEMWDVGMMAYTNTCNYGMNLEISVGCDLTDFIISQRGMFAGVVQKQVAATALRTIALNPEVRVNRNQVNASREELLYELDGNPSGRATGLGHELSQAYKALSLDTRGLDRVCLQCNNHGARYRTV